MAKAGAGIAKQAAQKARLGYDAGYAAALKDAEGDYAAGYQAGLAQGRAEAVRLREEVEAMAAAVAKFAGDFQGRAETLLESLEGRKDDAGTDA